MIFFNNISPKLTVNRYFLAKAAMWIFILHVSLLSGLSQEFDINVKVITQSTFSVPASFFTDLETQLNEFVNTTNWTNDVYQKHERIKGSLQLIIMSENSGSFFAGELIFQTQRPVFNSSYDSPIINLLDRNIAFKYTGVEPILKTTSVYYDNLSSIISYYMYIALALDYDSFSLYGGSSYLELAKEVTGSLPSAVAFDEGWRVDSATKKNRYFILENLLNPNFRPFRQAFYEYHRLAMDNMSTDPARSRAMILSVLGNIGQADADSPNSMIIQVFGDTKRFEIIDVFKVADKGQRTKVTDIMVGMDKAKRNDYKVLD